MLALRKVILLQCYFPTKMNTALYVVILLRDSLDVFLSSCSPFQGLMIALGRQKNDVISALFSLPPDRLLC